MQFGVDAACGVGKLAEAELAFGGTGEERGVLDCGGNGEQEGACRGPEVEGVPDGPGSSASLSTIMTEDQ